MTELKYPLNRVREAHENFFNSLVMALSNVRRAGVRKTVELPLGIHGLVLSFADKGEGDGWHVYVADTFAEDCALDVQMQVARKLPALYAAVLAAGQDDVEELEKLTGKLADFPEP